MNKTISVHPTQNCGIKEISPISGTKQSHRILFEAGIDYFRPGVGDQGEYAMDAAIVLFSDKVRPEGEVSRGSKLEAYIIAKGLGTVKKTPAVLNPNSGESIIMWVWIVDQEAYHAWYTAGIAEWGEDYGIAAEVEEDEEDVW